MEHDTTTFFWNLWIIPFPICLLEQDYSLKHDITFLLHVVASVHMLSQHHDTNQQADASPWLMHYGSLEALMCNTFIC